mgnify:CR=1 FL=1
MKKAGAKTTKKATASGAKVKKLSATKLKKLVGGGYRDRPDEGPLGFRDRGGPIGLPKFKPDGPFGMGSGSNRSRAGRGQTK